MGLAGCHHEDDTGKSKLESTYKTLAEQSPQVVVSPPVPVILNGRNLGISGTIHRQAGFAGVLDGRVDVDLIGPDGMLLDKSLHCHLIPAAIPADASQNATYAPTPFGYIPPAGSTLRARYVDRQAMILEDLKEGDLDYNGNGGHVGADVPRSQENGSGPTNPTGGGNIINGN
jgi:hypothetical protein